MALDLHITIIEGTPEALVVQKIAEAESITQEQAVAHILSEAAEAAGIQQMDPRKGYVRRRPPNLKIAEEKPLFGIFEGDDAVLKAIQDVIAERDQRYS